MQKVSYAKGYNQTNFRPRIWLHPNGRRQRPLLPHRKELEGVDYDSLRERKEVEFEVWRDRIGRPQAVRVRLPQEYKDAR
ncbi:hypothetical protein ACFLVX_02055 [Chloroflexota bacterium]